MSDTARNAARKIKDKIWRNFKVSVAEVEAGSPRELLIGVALVGSQAKDIDERLQSIVRFCQNMSDFELAGHDSRVVHYTDIELEADFEEKFS